MPAADQARQSAFENEYEIAEISYSFFLFQCNASPLQVVLILSKASAGMLVFIQTGFVNKKKAGHLINSQHKVQFFEQPVNPIYSVKGCSGRITQIKKRA